ncbi:MAG: BrnT family toxin [Acidobacteriaceae bacterium]|nr:BrnT family toxin [Acidobacteriaceae bacterium]
MYIRRTYNGVAASEIKFDWDEGNLRHIAGHNVTRAEAEEVILNEPIEINYEVIDGEERYVDVGPTNIGRFLTIVSTERNGRIRVITAFDSDRDDESAYWAVKGA